MNQEIGNWPLAAERHRIAAPDNPLFSPRRVGAMVLRHFYLLRGSWARVAEMAYWPIIGVLIWGFMSDFLTTQTSYVARAPGVLLAGLMLWDLLARGNLGLSLTFLEEVWSRNLGHLAVSPLTIGEWIASMFAMALLRTAIGMVPAVILATYLYHFSLLSIGPALVLFAVNLLLFGWAFGLAVSGLVLRFGQGAESLAWVAVIAVAPFCGVYYPLSALPAWLQPLAVILPPSYVFEAMRDVMFGRPLALGMMGTAALLNLVYMAVAVAIFLRVCHTARVRGLFLGQGE